MGVLGKVIDGKLAAAELLERLGKVVIDLKKEHGVVPSLAVIIVGNDPASKLYVGNKQKKATELGLDSKTIELPVETTQEELLSIIDKLNCDKGVHGILVQLPLPRHIDKTLVINAISPEKDVDGFHNDNAGKLLTGQMDCMIPCTPQGCVHLIKKVRPNLSGSNAVVLGRSNIVGKPTALLLLYENCSVSILHSGTTDIVAHCRRADVVIAAVGRAALVKAEWIRSGAIVIDVGINLITQEGKNRFVGDVDFNGVQPIASAITPVPGGVGPVTIAYLLVNTVLGACWQCGIDRRYEIRSSLLQ